MGEAFLCFLPFYRVQADCIGFALGTEERRRTRGTGKNRRVETYEVDVERRCEESFDRTYPALDVGEWGIAKVDLKGDPLVAFDSDALDRQGMVFPPTGSADRVRRVAVEQFKARSDPGRGLKRVRFRFLETLRERLSVIYYPLWVVRYHFQERSYQILVDGEDGSLAYGKAPGNDLFRALSLVAAEAVAMFVGTTAVQIGGGHIGLLFLIGGFVLAIFAWGWKRFRHGGVVIEGTGVEGRSGFAKAFGRARKAPRRALEDLAVGKFPGGVEL